MFGTTTAEHDPPGLLFRWLGVAGIELRAGGQTLLVDPFFTRPPFWRMWFGRVSPDGALAARHAPRADHCLVTHAHWDHLMDVAEIAGRTGALALGSANTCRLLQVSGLETDHIQRLEVGDQLQLGRFHVEVLPAEHVPIPGFGPGPLPSRLSAPLRLRDYRMDDCFSLLVETQGVRLLDWRSVHSQPARSAEVLCVGFESRMQELAALLRAVAPQLVIPVHWDDFFRPLSQPLLPFWQPSRRRFPPLQRLDLHAFARQIKELAPGARVLIPEPLRRYDLGDILVGRASARAGEPAPLGGGC